MHFSMSNVLNGSYQAQLFNSQGQLVFQYNMTIFVNFIDDSFIVPANLPSGVYHFHLVTNGLVPDKEILVL